MAVIYYCSCSILARRGYRTPTALCSPTVLLQSERDISLLKKFRHRLITTPNGPQMIPSAAPPDPSPLPPFSRRLRRLPRSLFMFSVSSFVSQLCSAFLSGNIRFLNATSMMQQFLSLEPSRKVLFFQLPRER